MKNVKLNVDLFDKWFIFYYKWNNHIVVWNKPEWVYILDIDYDKEFSWNENEVYFETFEYIEEFLFNSEFNWEIDLSLFTNSTEYED